MHILRYLFLALFAGTCINTGIAQQRQTFADKRHSSGTNRIELDKSGFKSLKVKHGKSTYKAGPQTFNLSPNWSKLAQPQGLFISPQNDGNYQHSIIRKSKSGVPTHIKSKANSSLSARAGGDIETICKTYLKDIAPLLKIDDVTNEFQATELYKDELGQSHVKLNQVYKGVKVYASEVILHLENNAVKLFNGHSIPSPNIKSTKPKLSAGKALDLVVTKESINPYKIPLNVVLSDFELPEAELLIYPTNNGDNKLVWHHTVFTNIKDRWEYYIDANTGEVFDKYYHTCTLHANWSAHSHSSSAMPPSVSSGKDLNGVTREFNTFNSGGTHFLIDATKDMFDASGSLPNSGKGVIWTIDLGEKPLTEDADFFQVTSSSTSWNNPTAVSAHYAAETAFDYFKNTFSRNSINGQGGNVLSIINVADDDGSGLDNAFWNGIAIFYGNGKSAFSPLAGSLDVAGHEMSHGVVQNTANLEYRFQSGAINESMADVFGVLIDRDDWRLGEDVVKTSVFPSGALRDMQDPHNGGNQLGDNGWQPSHMSEFFSGPQDNGGVHINSGIPNRAFYLFATTTSRDVAERVYYRALTTYLTASSDFDDLRIAIVQSSADLHGASSNVVNAAKSAFDQVGILEGASPGNDDDGDLPVASGDDFILSYDVNGDDPTTLYISDTQASPASFEAISQTKLFRKPSVADDGSLAIYVTENNTINAINLSDTPNERVISDQQIWSNVSLSKDGSKLAVIRNDNSNKIFVFDLVADDLKEFTLFNPTSAEGVTTGNVEYPDAIEWDYTGQYLIYDALNSLTTPTGDDIEYWDVGFIQVWDNERDRYGDGNIQKLFTNLPDGISIGNPSFAKTSRNVVAFDLFDANSGDYEVLTANIETNTVKRIFENNKLGYPNFSKLDDKLLFDTNNGNDIVAVVNLAADKITPSGDPEGLINFAKWAVWYTVGERELLSSENSIITFSFDQFDQEVRGEFFGTDIVLRVPEGTDKTTLVATFESSNATTVRVGENIQLSRITSNDFTEPVIYSVIAENGEAKEYRVRVLAGDEVTGLDNASEIDLFEIFPNPSHHKVFLKHPNLTTDVNVYLLNTVGQVMTTSQWNSGIQEISIDLSGLADGAYILKLESQDQIDFKHIIKE